ncbi:MAG: WD40 repeat domain-containing serine/threonine protein kinase [Gemmataceae bacterium]
MNGLEPSDDDLVAFDQGLLDDAAMERVAGWLEANPAGEQRLARVTGAAHNSPLQALRQQQVSADEIAGDQELVDQVLARALGQQLEVAAVPEIVRDYRVGRLIGKGGMGAVYEARHAFMERDVALKLLPPLLSADANFRARFQRETAVIAQLDHPNLVRAFDAGSQDGQLFLAMERLVGNDVAHLLEERGALPIADACEIVRQAALGLDHAHQRDIVHRDIKPGNLFLTRAGVVKVIDLGLARPHSASALTSALTVMGTPEYMAPEQWESAAVGPAADLYALGCTLFTLLTGSPPFAGSGSGSWVSVMDAHRQQQPPLLRDVRADVPPGLAELVQRLLAKSPAERPGSAAELARGLLPFTTGHGLGAVSDIRSQQPTRAFPSPGAIKPGKSRKIAVAAVGGVALVVVVLAVLPFLGSREPPQPAGPDRGHKQAIPARLEPALTFTGHAGKVLSLAVSPDSSLVASGSEDDTILLWDPKAGKARPTLRGHPGDVFGLAFAPDGRTLASSTSASDECEIRLWDVATATPKQQLGGANHGLFSVAYSPDGKYLAGAGFDRVINVYDPGSGKRLHSIPMVIEKFVRVLSVAGDRAATGGNRSARVWDIPSGKEIPSNLPPALGPTFLPGGKRVAGWIYAEGRIVLCDVPSGENMLSWRAHAGTIEGLAVSPDGRFLVSAGSDGAVIWSSKDGRELTRLVGHRGKVYSVAFAPDMSFVATGGADDNTVRIWTLPEEFRR